MGDDRRGRADHHLVRARRRALGGLATPSVGRLVAEALAEAGAEWAFTVPGESVLEVIEALPQVGVRVVATRHEGGAAFMAEAIAQLTGRPAACLGTRAVGATNMSIGIHAARQNSSPLVALLGQVDSSVRGREAFQEVDLVRTIGGLAKWAAELDDPATAPAKIAEGLRAAQSDRPGPILFALPRDVLRQPVEGARLDVAPATPPPPDPAAVEAVLRLLAGARRPLILAGGGVLRARATGQLVALAEATGVPVMAAWRRPDVFPNDHPLYLGMSGLDAPATVLPRLLDADALLVIGCRLNEMTSFGYRAPADGTRWAHVDLQPRRAHAGLRAPEMPIVADAAAFLSAALDVVASGGAAPGEGARAEANAADRAAYEAARVVDRGSWEGPGVHPGRVVTTLQRVLADDAIVTTDAGNFNGWIARGFAFNQAGTFLGPTSGAMGYGLPAAVAASLARPGRQVVAMCGDGGFAMLMAELETAVREGAQPLAMVFDNRRYGTIAMHQAREGRALTATDLGAIDFAAFARACGAHGATVGRDDELEPALREALGSGRPAVLHVELDPAWVAPDLSPVSG